MAEPLRLYGLKAFVTSAGDGVGEAVASDAGEARR